MAMGAAAARAASEVQNYQGVHKQSAGFRLLASMGWQEGQGLGAKGQGITSHVKVSKKDDTTGIGSAEALRKAHDWTAGMAVYDRVLASLKIITPGQMGTASSSSDSDSESLQPPLQTEKRKAEVKPKAVVGERPKKKKAASQLEAKGIKKPKKAPKLAADEHASHSQRLRRNKTVKAYSATDLAAILGAGEAGGVAMTLPAAVVKSSSCDSSETQEVGEVLKESQSQPQCRQWWHSFFRKAGSSGAGSLGAYAVKFKPDVRISGFSEDDQAGLWQRLQDDQTRNKQGLGKSAELKKVGGTNWEGTKTVIESEGEEDTVAIQAASRATAKLKRAKRDGVPVAEVQQEGGCGRKRVKWKKLATQTLEANQGGPMTLRKFKARMWKASGLDERKVERLHEMALVLQSSSKFTVKADTISLRPS